jgi:hypothetical protein
MRVLRVRNKPKTLMCFGLRSVLRPGALSQRGFIGILDLEYSIGIAVKKYLTFRYCSHFGGRRGDLWQSDRKDRALVGVDYGNGAMVAVNDLFDQM